MNEQQVFLAFILGTLLLTILTISLGLFLIEHKKKQRKNRLQQQQLEFDYQNQLLQARLTEQEKSMTLISEEIHDNIGQVLGLAKMYLHNVLAETTTSKGKKFGTMAEELLTKAIDDLRDISHSLNSELLQRTGLNNSLEREITFLQETTSIHCAFKVEGEPYPLAREKNVLVFRIAQETLQNAVKHAKAKNIDLVVKYGNDLFTMIIKDDGIGFNLSAARENNSLGLRNMISRADLLKGTIDINTTRSMGTIITLQIPNYTSNYE